MQHYLSMPCLACLPLVLVPKVERVWAVPTKAGCARGTTRDRGLTGGQRTNESPDADPSGGP